MSTAKILESLQPLAVAVGILKFDPENVRLHDQVNLGSIAYSLDRFGQRKPLVVRKADNQVIAGNGTLQAALSLGWDRVAVVYVEDSPDDARAYALADNRTAELAGWDEEALALLLESTDKDFQAAMDWEIPDFDDPADDVTLPPPPEISGTGTVDFRFGDVRAVVPKDIYDAFLRTMEDHETVERALKATYLGDDDA